MLILIVVVGLTILISANCSLYEAVLYSTRMATLESSKAKGKKIKLANLFIGMKKNVSQPIAAILIMNTIANTAGATIAGMYAAKVLGVSMMPVFSIIFTLAILFIAEIIPKTTGAVHWRKLWPVVTLPLKFMRFILYPAIAITERLTQLLTKKSDTSTITEDEILALVHLGAKEGEISYDESRMVRNIINLEERKVYDIMTPRKMIFSLDVNLILNDVKKITEEKGFTRIPVYEKDRENIIGYVLKGDINSLKYIDQSKITLRSIIRPITLISRNDNCLTLLTNFLKQRKHIAMVTDEYGGIDGLVTLEDLLESVLGAEIVDETDKIVDLQEEARKSKKK